MSDAIIFVAVFGGLFAARVVVATLVFLWILPTSEVCPICDAPTLRMRRRILQALLPRFRPSWCPECGWEGLLRGGARRPVQPVAARRPPLARRR